MQSSNSAAARDRPASHLCLQTSVQTSCERARGGHGLDVAFLFCRYCTATYPEAGRPRARPVYVVVCSHAFAALSGGPHRGLDVSVDDATLAGLLAWYSLIHTDPS